MARRYEQRKRAEQQEETRERIARAAMELHGIDGPARTSVSAIAERAGVQRNTVYRYFPDDQALLFACSGLFMVDNPLPDPAAWREITDPVERARQAFGEVYAYWEATEATTANVLRDAEVHDATRQAAIRSFQQPLHEIRDAIAAGWPRGKQRERVLAAAELGIDFRTWQSLVRHSGLTSAAAASLMAEMVDAAATAKGP